MLVGPVMNAGRYSYPDMQGLFTFLSHLVPKLGLSFFICFRHDCPTSVTNNGIFRRY
jgi:hypothetical protein